MYTVGNFIYHELPSGDVVVQNQAGIVMINNEQMKDWIKILDTKTNTDLSEEVIRQHFREYCDQSIEFLLKYKIIQHKIQYSYNVSTVHFFTNNKVVAHNINQHMSNFFSDFNLNFSVVDSPYGAKNSNLLNIIFLNPYDKKLATEIVSETKKNGNLLLMTYTYNNSFYIDSLYCHEWKKPCHLCHMGHIESQLRTSQFGELTYQNLIDLLYNQEPNFQVETSLNVIDIYSIVTMIFNYLDKLIFRSKGNALFSNEALEDINYSIMYDLQTKKIAKDISIHWELCDCYE